MKLSGIGKLFSPRNRGMMLDIFVFLITVFLMRLMTKNFVGLLQEAGDGDEFAGFTLFLFCLGILILPPLGATLKRWHFHQRLKMQGITSAQSEDLMSGCLFNPIFFFCLNIVIYCCINALVLQYFYGDKDPGGTVFVSSIFFGLALVIFQTIIVYRYFSPPKTAPTNKFLLDPRSETVGDMCIYLNMILFQIIWNLMTTFPGGRVGSFAELGGRIFLFSFLALLIYFPPRIFYLAEDIKRRRVWLTILLANSPVIFRIVFGS